ncbi:MAG: hypothetical protein R3Y54_13030 [Eubacteriales bacterium]
MSNDFLTEWKKEASDPVELTKSSFKLAKDLYNNGKENNQQITTIYHDIVYINSVISSSMPYNYASVNMQVTSKYDFIPNVGDTTFHKTTLEALESKGDLGNIRTLSLIAQSLQILMLNIKMGQVVSIVLNNVIEHSVNSGFNALFKSDY